MRFFAVCSFGSYWHCLLRLDRCAVWCGPVQELAFASCCRRIVVLLMSVSVFGVHRAVIVVECFTRETAVGLQRHRQTRSKRTRFDASNFKARERKIGCFYAIWQVEDAISCFTLPSKTSIFCPIKPSKEFVSRSCVAGRYGMPLVHDDAKVPLTLTRIESTIATICLKRSCLLGWTSQGRRNATSSLHYSRHYS